MLLCVVLSLAIEFPIFEIYCTLVIGYCDYLGTGPTNSHRAIVVTRK